MAVVKGIFVGTAGYVARPASVQSEQRSEKKSKTAAVHSVALFAAVFYKPFDIAFRSAACRAVVIEVVTDKRKHGERKLVAFLADHILLVVVFVEYCGNISAEHIFRLVFRVFGIAFVGSVAVVFFQCVDALHAVCSGNDRLVSVFTFLGSIGELFKLDISGFSELRVIAAESASVIL